MLFILIPLDGKLTHFQRIRTTPDSFKGICRQRRYSYPCRRKIFIRHQPRKFQYHCCFCHPGRMENLKTNKSFLLTGKHPRNFVIDPTSRFLLVANRDTDNIVMFSIDPVSGLLKATGKEISIPNPVCLKFLA